MRECIKEGVGDEYTFRFSGVTASLATRSCYRSFNLATFPISDAFTRSISTLIQAHQIESLLVSDP